MNTLLTFDDWIRLGQYHVSPLSGVSPYPRKSSGVSLSRRPNLNLRPRDWRSGPEPCFTRHFSGNPETGLWPWTETERVGRRQSHPGNTRGRERVGRERCVTGSRKEVLGARLVLRSDLGKRDLGGSVFLLGLRGDNPLPYRLGLHGRGSGWRRDTPFTNSCVTTLWCGARTDMTDTWSL